MKGPHLLLVPLVSLMAIGCGAAHTVRTPAPKVNLAAGVKSVDEVFRWDGEETCLATISTHSGATVLFESKDQAGCRELESAAKTVTNLQAAQKAAQANVATQKPENPKPDATPPEQK